MIAIIVSAFSLILIFSIYEILRLLDAVKRRDRMIENLRDSLKRLVAIADFSDHAGQCQCPLCGGRYTLSITSGGRK